MVSRKKKTKGKSDERLGLAHLKKEEKWFLGAMAVIATVFLVNIVLYGVALGTVNERIQPPAPPKLEAIHLAAPFCPECFDTGTITAGLKGSGIEIKEREVDYTSPEGQKLVERYGVERIPALILSGETTKDERLTTYLLRLGNRVGDDFVIQDNPPYINVATGQLIGGIEVIYLNDSSCQTCYNVTLHREVLANFGIFVERERTIDVASTEGKELISRYSITAAPTVLLSPEIQVYQRLVDVWPQVGTTESDGWLVFRNGDIMQQWGGYKNVTG